MSPLNNWEREGGHMERLQKEFPGIWDNCIGAYVGPGWVALLRPCLEVLTKHRCSVAQVKQKFCGLRCYWDPPNEDQVLSDEARNEIDSVIAEAERVSLRTCERCGAETNDQHTGHTRAGQRLCAICEGACS